MLQVLDAFVKDMSKDVGCSQLNAAANAYKESFCCDVGGALYWWIASWYLLAFVICLCGWPASLLGYKRFVRELWGPQYRAHKQDADDGTAPSSPYSMSEDDALLSARSYEDGLDKRSADKATIYDGGLTRESRSSSRVAPDDDNEVSQPTATSPAGFPSPHAMQVNPIGRPDVHGTAPSAHYV